jgi:hypothetical protein
MRRAVVALVSVLLWAAPQAGQGQAPAFPAQVERLLANAHVTADDRKQLLAGLPVSKPLPADASKELAVFGALWINAPIDRYVQRLTDIEQFERGGRFKLTKKIGSPPALADFAQLRLPDEDISDLRECQIDDCELKLTAFAIQRFQKEIDWRVADPRPAVDTLMRRVAFDYVSAYLKGGNQQLPVYRDHGRAISTAGEFKDMADGMQELPLFGPDLRRYLIEFPAVTWPNSSGFLYWQETEFGLKPIIRISHLTIRQNGPDLLVASKMIYATHYFWTALDLRAAVPDPARGNGFWLVATSRSRNDGLSGLTGLFIRHRVRSEVVEGTLNVLRSTKEKLEGPDQGQR